MDKEKLSQSIDTPEHIKVREGMLQQIVNEPEKFRDFWKHYSSLIDPGKAEIVEDFWMRWSEEQNQK